MTDLPPQQQKPPPGHPLDVPPVPVHVMGIEAGVTLGQAPAQPPPTGQMVCRPFTVTITAANPVQNLLDQDDERQYALVQAGGNDVVINNNFSEIGNAANQAVGLPAPIGMILPFGNTVPTMIPGGQRWWATAAAYPAQVTVLVVQKAS